MQYVQYRFSCFVYFHQQNKYIGIYFVDENENNREICIAHFIHFVIMLRQLFFSVPIILFYLRVILAKFLRNNNVKSWLTL